MPTQSQIQNTLLQSQLAAANIILDNTLAEIGGNSNINWLSAVRFYINIFSLEKQFLSGDYTSNGTISIYDCLNNLLGLDNSMITIDPNYQPPSGQIIKVNINLPPITILWSDFSTIGSPDAGVTRINYFNPDWIGVNPFMALTSPGLTGLELNTDYVLIPTGGFTLLLSGNLPGIFDGEIITVYNYAFA